MSKKMLTFIDLFAGIGGFRIAFEKAGYQCVYSCEIDSACRTVYRQNFQDEPQLDITKINLKTLPEFDVLTAGFPCQPFSICGKKEGFEDTRGTLFFNICEIINYKKPPVVVLENVKHLIHHDQGKTLKIIVHSLQNLGYKISYQLLNAKNFGLPQNRERIIIIATKNNFAYFNFDLIRHDNKMIQLKDFLDEKDNFEYLKPNEYTLIETPIIQKSGLIFIGYRNNKTIRKKGVRANTYHLSRVHRQPNRIYSADGVHPTLSSQETSGRFFIYIPEEKAVRKLTIQECYRIMGFPETFKKHHNLGECYKQIGNSVPISMVYEIARELKCQIFSENDFNISELKINSPIQLSIPGLTL